MNNYKSLVNRVEELENKYNSIEDNISSQEPSFNCLNFSKQLINYQILESKKITLANFEVKRNNTICITCQINTSLQTQQDVELKLFTNGKQIYNSIKSLRSGEEEFSFFTDFVPQKNEDITIEIEITPLMGVLVTIKNIALIVIGTVKNEINLEYNAIEVDDKYLLSTIINNSLYYCYVPKTNKSYTLSSFSYFNNSISHSFIYDKLTSTLFLFRIDKSGRLFFSNFEERNETLIDLDTKCVSSAINDETIIATYIKNKSCYFIEIRKNEQITNKKRININNFKLEKCNIYFNELRNKFYVILTDKNNSNYLIESVDENFSHGENITATYSINIETYKGE